MARVPPAPPHQLLEPRLIASMQFELISCFRWSLANQGRQEAEVGAIKLTALGPGSLRRKKQSRHQKAPPPTPTSPSLGFKPPPSNTPHFLGESSSSLLPHMCLVLGHLPLTSGTQRGQGKALQHESPWRVVLCCLRARLGFEDEAPPGMAISPNTTASSSPAMGSTLRHLQFPSTGLSQPLPLVTCPASARPPHLPSLPLLAPSF